MELKKILEELISLNEDCEEILSENIETQW
jgi:hypothetical protein